MFAKFRGLNTHVGRAVSRSNCEGSSSGSLWGTTIQMTSSSCCYFWTTLVCDTHQKLPECFSVASPPSSKSHSGLQDRMFCLMKLPNTSRRRHFLWSLCSKSFGYRTLGLYVAGTISKYMALFSPIVTDTDVAHSRIYFEEIDRGRILLLEIDDDVSHIDSEYSIPQRATETWIESIYVLIEKQYLEAENGHRNVWWVSTRNKHHPLLRAF